jgi:hypothetical protein
MVDISNSVFVPEVLNKGANVREMNCRIQRVLPPIEDNVAVALIKHITEYAIEAVTGLDGKGRSCGRIGCHGEHLQGDAKHGYVTGLKA